MERKSKEPDDEATGRNGEAWRTRVAADLAAHAAEQHRLYGGIDELTLARYEAGTSPAEERARVEQAMNDHPALRECMEISRDLAAGREIAPIDASQRKRQGEEPWTDRPNRPKPETSR